ncbi:MAG: type IV pilus assembly protein PilM [Legionellales bacterium]|nr:type IV pilus assembly protein PilM [Legionellales bacterium]
MLKLFKSKSLAILGIDISTTSVKILQLSKNGDRYCVEGYGRASLPENAMDGYLVKDSEAVADCIKNIIKTTGLTCKQVAIAVPESSAISKVIQLNEGLNDAEIEELVVMDADKYIPYPIDEVNMDFCPMGTSLKNSAMQDVLIVASRAENVSNRVGVIQLAGLEAVIVDVESYAVERAAQLLKPSLPANGDKKNIAIIDMGSTYTHIFVLHDMKIIFSREEQFGSKQLLDEIMQHYGLSWAEALALIEHGPLPEDYEKVVLQPFKELILLQVKRALQFFFSNSHHTFVDHIIFAGGVAKLSDITQLLREHINVPTTTPSFFEEMSVVTSVDRDALREDSPMLMLLCGLALRQIE